MKRLISFVILFSSIFASNSVLGMKRKRSPEDNANKPYKKRRIMETTRSQTQPLKESIYDKYKRSDGEYHCPNCNYQTGNVGNFSQHIYRMGHAGKEKRVQNAPKKNDYYRRKHQQMDGYYYCPDCPYRTNKIRNFTRHVSNKGHAGQEKNWKKKEAKTSKYDIYKKWGEYYCPDCLYHNDIVSNFSRHLRRTGHAGKEKIGKKEPKVSKYHRYKSGDIYYCPDCQYQTDKANLFSKHLCNAGHAGKAKTGNKAPKTSKYDRYKKTNDEYYCPECEYHTDSVVRFRKHVYRTDHARN